MTRTGSLALSEFCEVVQGGRTRLTGNDFTSDGYPAYGAGGLNGLVPNFEFERSAVILSSIGARCGKCFFADGKWTSLANTQVILPRADIADTKFLWYQLNDESRWLRSGTAQPFIKPSVVKSERVFLPPLPEQHRIAAILDQADALRAKRRTALAQLDEMMQAIFMDMFEGESRECKNFARCSFGDLLDVIYRYPTYYGIDYVESGVPEVRGELLMDDGSILQSPDKMRYISEATAARYPKTTLLSGDLVMSVRGTIGKVGLVDETLAGANMTANLLRLSPKRDILHPTFAWHLTQSSLFGKSLLSASSTTTIATITSDRLKAISVSLPPMHLQKKFVEKVEALKKVRLAASALQKALDTLFASLQHRAFRGEL